MWRAADGAGGGGCGAQALEEPGLALHDHGGLFGIFGAQVSVVDSEGRYIYMRGPARANNSPLYQYTLMPTRMRGFFGQVRGPARHPCRVCASRPIESPPDVWSLPPPSG